VRRAFREPTLVSVRRRPRRVRSQNAAGFDISGALLAKGDFSKTNFVETQFSKVYGPGAKFDGADFTNGVIDRAYFKGASFKGANFNNAVLSSSSFEEADLTDADFTDAYLGTFDQKRLCKNPLLQGENPKTGTPTRARARRPDSHDPRACRDARPRGARCARACAEPSRSFSPRPGESAGCAPK
jgi:hypothetical protein